MPEQSSSRPQASDPPPNEQGCAAPDFLALPPPDLPSAPDHETLGGRVRHEMAHGWRSYQRPSVESLLVEYPGLVADPAAVFELLYAEFLYREELGETPGLAEFQMRFPEFAGQLEQQLRQRKGLHWTERQHPGQAVPSEAGTQLLPEAGRLPVERLPASTVGETQRVGDYQVLEEIGRGGMGVV